MRPLRSSLRITLYLHWLIVWGLDKVYVWEWGQHVTWVNNPPQFWGMKVLAGDRIVNQSFFPVGISFRWLFPL